MASILLSPTIGSYSGLQSSLADVDVEETQRKPSSREWSSYSKQKSPKKEKKMISPILRESVKEPNSRPMSRSFTSPEIVLRKRSPRSDTDLNLSFTRKSYDKTGYNGSSASDGVVGIVQAENILREKIRRRYTDIRDAFQTLDLQKSCTVNAGDFRRVIHAFCLQLSDEQFNHLLVKIGAKKDSTINYISFLEKFRTGPVFMSDTQRSISSPPRTGEQRQESFEELESRLRIKLNSSLLNFLKAVRLFDYNRDGHIQRNELKRVLESCCFKMSDFYFEKLLQKYDITRNNHSIEYMDFLKRLGVDLRSREQQQPRKQHLFLDRPSKSREQETLSSFSGNSDTLVGLTLPQVEKKFREKMILKFPDVKRAFVAFDKKRDGFITLDELKRVLINFVFPMSDQMFSQLMERCGVRATHKIAYEHFLDKFKHLGQEGNGQTIPIKPSHKVNPIREAESPLEMKDVWTLLRNHIANSYSSIKKAFLVFDDDKDGRVNRKEFRKILKTFPFQISNDQFKEVMRRVDPDGNGYISYHQFLNTFEAREGQGAHPWLSNERKINQSYPLQTLDRQRAEDILRTKIMDNWKTIAKAFIKVDENNDGFISQRELKTLLSRFHLPISEDHFKDLWTKCDMNFDGKIQYEEFMKQLGVDITSGDISGISTRITDESEEKMQLMKTDQLSRLKAASKNAFSRTTQMNARDVINVLRDHMLQKSSDFRKTFLQYDYDGDGKLSRKEFRLTLENLGLLMHDDQYKELTNRLGFFNGKLSYQEFLERFEDIERFGEGGKTLHLNNHRFNKVIERSESMTAEEVEEIMRKKIHESFQTLRQAFYSVDANHDAQITRPEFRRLLDMFMIPINDTEFDRLMTEKLHVMKNGTISYKEFIRRFQQNENFKKGHPWLFSDQNLNSPPMMPNLTAREASRCLKEKATDQWHDISTAFRAFDKDGNCIVTKEELRAILHRFNISVSPQEFGKLWKMYDVDRNGYVDHDEFLRRLGVEFAPGDVHGVSNKITKGSEDEIYRHNKSQQMKQDRATLNQANTTAFMSALDVEKQLRDKFRDNFESFRKAFEQVDADKDGLVSKAELMRILQDHHFYMSDKELACLLTRIGFGNKDSLSYGHFLSAFEDPRLSGNGKISLDSPISVPDKVTFDSAEDLTPEQAIIKLRKKVAQNESSIRNAFGAFDNTGSGCIKKEDLHMIINSFCFKISDKQFKQLLNKMNVKTDGTVDYESFIESFQKSDMEASNRWLENLLKKDIKISPKQSAVPSYEVMEEKISDMVQARYNKISKAFADYDFDRSGRVHQDVMHQILSEHTLKLNRDHFNQLWNKFEQNNDGTISYKEFLKYFLGTNVAMANQNNEILESNGETNGEQQFLAEQQTYSETPFSPIRGERSANEIEDKIKTQVVKHVKGLTRSFKGADSHQNGEIQTSQFKDVLESFEVLISDEEASLLAKKYGVGNKGRINYMDFLKKNANDMNNNDASSKKKSRSPASKQIIRTENEFLNSLMSRIRREIQDDGKVMRRAFKAADRAGTGICSTIKLRQMMRRFRVNLNEEEFYHLMSYFDKDMTGQVSYNEFLKAHLVS